MAKVIAAGFTVAAVLALAQVRIDRSESGAQASAIGSLRAITSAQATYAAAYGGYARSLAALSAPCPGASGGFISPDLSSDPTMKSGYEIRLESTPPAAASRPDCRGQLTASAYYATAVPVEPGSNKPRAFAVDQNQVIWYSDTAVAPAPPFHETSAIHSLR
jgi:streptogramin lyase